LFIVHFEKFSGTPIALIIPNPVACNFCKPVTFMVLVTSTSWFRVSAAFLALDLT